ncbi:MULTISPECIES: hypothetical protein [Prochlorococcus]|uniref:Uncharacterized protein n=1 Tax=Prochlorococcus marinus (strain MIT 9303) TaxID=59922 RepID=A2C6I7_PROM3|nr:MULTISPECIES: hypothetical protein [Prochlorococcus]ABM77097.1 Hypothetical protein P9303_03451 [Prochlorococcus marinus str. MIT 9303]KZR65974.1 hypothetical protein PMIT1306_00295 [Prochlorococcus sp. MIT 1306]
MAATWEAGFRAAVKTGRSGWTVVNDYGRMRLKELLKAASLGQKTTTKILHQ